MSEQANVQVIKDIYAAFKRGDVQGILDRLTDDVEWILHLDPVVPWSGDYSGKARIPKFFENIAKSVQVLSFEPVEYLAQGDVVVSIGTFGCRANATGKSTQTRWVFIWRLKNGLVTSYEQFHELKLADIFRS
ncbi:MAG TPA: nuclear transport factor 2 family protein [Chthonomonadaceae bacterium]|nr:nuclear transport factor 2 family protein [Chthonomonadaceae bacterium]